MKSALEERLGKTKEAAHRIYTGLDERFKINEKFYKFYASLDKGFYGGNNWIAGQAEHIGINKKNLGRGLKLTSMLALPLIFTRFDDGNAYALLASSYSNYFVYALDIFDKMHSFVNAALYERGLRGIGLGAITTSVASIKGNEFFCDAGIATMITGVSLLGWASANYIERKSNKKKNIDDKMSS